MKSIVLALLLIFPGVLIGQLTKRPNVVVIITDDQGYGDLGYTGNPNIKTPVLDNFAKQSIRFNNFYVSPVCAPTRASLMTGRYSLRTGIRDTYNGGAIMAASEITIAELLQEANYETGIFGKWHLGDNYPSRPMDQGFNESLIHLSGGMGQVGDFTTWFKKDRSYFDPVLWHNGKQQSYTGYCSDIFADNAIKFIEKNKERPFLCYLSFNAPHTPLQVPESYYQMYKDLDPAKGFDGGLGLPGMMTEKDKEDARRVYAMVSNIDDNVGKLFRKLEELQLTEDTLVIFMTDNGPQQLRYVAGMKGRKGSVYRGGVRVPFFLSYPRGYKMNREVETTAAHIDILPTIAEICEVELPSDRKIDGKSLVPLLKGQPVNWEHRPIFSYWTRRYPEKYYGMALQKGRDKLVAYTNSDASISDFELFDIVQDPYEHYNRVKENPLLGEGLKKEMEEVYAELIASENLMHPPRIEIGNAKENPIVLNRNDAGGERGIWDQEEVYGKWHVRIKEGNYNIRFKFIKPVQGGGKLILETGTVINQMKIASGETDLLTMDNIHLSSGDCDLIPFYALKGQRIFPFWVALNRVN